MQDNHLPESQRLPENPKNHTAYLISDIARLHRTIMDRRASKYGLTRSQWWLLSFLVYFDGATQQTLVDVMDISKGALAKLLERLEIKGMIRREPHELDKRSKRVFLTEAATILSRSLESDLSNAADETFSILEPAELEKLHEVLGKVRDHVGEKVADIS